MQRNLKFRFLIFFAIGFSCILILLMAFGLPAAQKIRISSMEPLMDGKKEKKLLSRTFKGLKNMKKMKYLKIFEEFFHFQKFFCFKNFFEVLKYFSLCFKIFFKLEGSKFFKN